MEGGQALRQQHTDSRRLHSCLDISLKRSSALVPCLRAAWAGSFAQTVHRPRKPTTLARKPSASVSYRKKWQNLFRFVLPGERKAKMPLAIRFLFAIIRAWLSLEGKRKLSIFSSRSCHEMVIPRHLRRSHAVWG